MTFQHPAPNNILLCFLTLPANCVLLYHTPKISEASVAVSIDFLLFRERDAPWEKLPGAIACSGEG